MTTDNPYGLTEREREVLRLVDRTRSTGEIASIVNRSVNTVEAQIKSARRRLGNIDRFRAADLLRQAEAGDQSGVNPRLVMAEPAAGHAGERLQDDPMDAVAGDRWREATPTLVDVVLPGPPDRRDTRPNHDRSPLKTLVLIAALAAASALLLLAAPQLAVGAQRIAHRMLSTP